MEIHGNDRVTLVAGFLSTWQMFSPSGDNDRGVLPNPLAVSGWGFETTCELIKLDGSWYVTGLSTFPRSRERQEVAELVDDFIAYSQSNGPAPVQDEQSGNFLNKSGGRRSERGKFNSVT